VTEREQVDKLLAACAAYHKALDTALAMLIIASQEGYARELFLPSQSALWPAVVNGRHTVAEVQAARARAEAS